MSEPSDILLLSDPASGDALTERLGGRAVIRCDEPYDALRRMGRRRWPVVVLTAQTQEFDGLCRAARRLQPDARLFALCPPAAEPEVGPLAGETLDDYFIDPPTSADVDRMLGVVRPAAEGEPPEPAREAADTPFAPPAGALDGREISELIDSARRVSAVEPKLADVLGRKLQASVWWTDADDVPADAQILLLAGDECPRALVCGGDVDINDPHVAQLIASVQELSRALLENARRNETLHRLAVTDHLTGAYNRRYFYILTDQILARSQARSIRVSLLLYDLDFFKQYNDTYGYAAGDEILRETAALVRTVTRAHDVVARIGGDEFAVLFWDAGKPRDPGSRPVESAYALADRFRRAVSAHQFARLGPDATGALSISGGLARFPEDGTTCRGLLASADRALKEAKHSGRNAIHIIGGD